MRAPPTFKQPENMARHNQEVFDGCYDVPILELHEPRVLDIGACCGAFSVWAQARWPGAQIDAFEPNPEAFAYLQQNAVGAQLHNVGVRRSFGFRSLRAGRNNLGEASFLDIGEQGPEGDAVECMAVTELPKCDVLKVDTEGCEVEIIATYTMKIAEPKIVAFEFHRAEDFLLLHDLLAKSYVLMRARVEHPDRGTVAFARRDMVRR